MTARFVIAEGREVVRRSRERLDASADPSTANVAKFGGSRCASRPGWRGTALYVHLFVRFQADAFDGVARFVLSSPW